MAWSTLKLHDLVYCGYCGIETTVEDAKLYDGQPGFELGCGHRNGFCADCNSMARDTSSTQKAIEPVCQVCSG